jgi:hypothetical protein
VPAGIALVLSHQFQRHLTSQLGPEHFGETYDVPSTYTYNCSNSRPVEAFGSASYPKMSGALQLVKGITFTSLMAFFLLQITCSPE